MKGKYLEIQILVCVSCTLKKKSVHPKWGSSFTPAKLSKAVVLSFEPPAPGSGMHSWACMHACSELCLFFFFSHLGWLGIDKKQIKEIEI